MIRLGKYTVLGRLGGGGMADVYLGIERTNSGAADLVALKTPRPDVADDPEFVSMFLDEAKLAARLQHSHVVQTVEVGEASGHHFIAMEYLAGQPLHKVIARVPELPLTIDLRLLADVLRGIHYAHELRDSSGAALNIIHRDLTPQNVFITYEGKTKILDFGIARAEGRSSNSSAGLMKGKVRYMSPEQVITHQLDRRADLFAVGVMLFEACTRRRMWGTSTELEILSTLHARRHIRSPQTVCPDVDDELDAICQRALAVIDFRYQTAAEFLRDLESYMDERAMPPEEELTSILTAVFGAKRAKMGAKVEAEIANVFAHRHPSSAPSMGRSLRDSCPDIEASIGGDEVTAFGANEEVTVGREEITVSKATGQGEEITVASRDANVLATSDTDDSIEVEFDDVFAPTTKVVDLRDSNESLPIAQTPEPAPPVRSPLDPIDAVREAFAAATESLTDTKDRPRKP